MGPFTCKKPNNYYKFRPYEVAILSLIAKVRKDIKVIWCDTGYNTPETYEHAHEIIQKLDLNIKLYVPKQTVGHRDAFLGIPHYTDTEHTIFTDQVKLEPFRRALEEHKPDVWFTNLRKGQTEFRNSIDILSYDAKEVLKVSPFYHKTDSELDEYLSKNKLPNEFNYFDPTNQLANIECGLHN